MTNRISRYFSGPDKNDDLTHEDVAFIRMLLTGKTTAATAGKPDPLDVAIDSIREQELLRKQRGLPPAKVDPEKLSPAWKEAAIELRLIEDDRPPKALPPTKVTACCQHVSRQTGGCKRPPRFICRTADGPKCICEYHAPYQMEIIRRV